ncbi:MAG: hypothetical protein RLZZ488_1785 [Pseudomonadota bacterium]|jgi:polyhydroxybutyrate depolymerase
MNATLIILIFATICVSNLSACVHARAKSSLGPNFVTRKISIQNRSREYLLFTPPGYESNQPTPVVIGFHGGETSNVIFARTSRLHNLAEQNNFLVVYPNGVDKHWNDGRGTSNPNIDDVGFVKTIVEDLKSIRNVNVNRIYATGISNGAFMTQRLACELSDVIAAFSAVAGSMGVNLRSACQPSRPVSMMIINSPIDNFVPWNGGSMKKGKGGNILSIPELVEFWKRHNSCGESEERTLPKRIANDKTKVVVRQHNGCREDTQLLFYTIEGGGHTWPSGADQPPWLVGPTSREMNATAESWNFFKRHSLKK